MFELTSVVLDMNLSAFLEQTQLINVTKESALVASYFLCPFTNIDQKLLVAETVAYTLASSVSVL
jgi:hypothetical protein